MTKPKKIYSTSKSVLEKFAKDTNKQLEFLKRGVGEGYCECEDSIRVFAKNSHVDTSEDFEDVTHQYIIKQFSL